MTRLQAVMSRLDGALTGKDRSMTDHTASNQHKTVEDWYLNAEHAWYLSDGGYSRVILHDTGRLGISFVSTDRVKLRWMEALEAKLRLEEGKPICSDAVDALIEVEGMIEELLGGRI